MEDKRQEIPNEEQQDIKKIDKRMLKKYLEDKAVRKYVKEKKVEEAVEMVKCPLCDFQTKYVSTFFAHIFSVHRNPENDTFIGKPKEIEIYVCEICGKSFYDYETAYLHFINWHPAEFSDALKQEQLMALRELKDTILQYGYEGYYYCPICNFKTQSDEEFYNHIKYVHYDIADEYFKFLEELTQEVQKEIEESKEEIKEIANEDITNNNKKKRGRKKKVEQEQNGPGGNTTENKETDTGN